MSTIADLITRLREEFLDDAVGAIEADYRWKTSEIVAALTWSQSQLATRLLLIEDSTTAAVCQISIAATNGVYPRSVTMSPLVLRVERLKFPGRTEPLIQTSVDLLDREDAGWDEKTGTPTHFVVNPQSRAITFNRQPDSGGTATLTVKRKPLAAFTNEGIESEAPEIEQEEAMLHGALSKLYRKDDKQTYDPARANAWSKAFEDDIREIQRTRAALAPRVHIMRPDRW